MSHFSTACIVRDAPGGWKLQQPLVYYSDYLGRTVVVPAGFFTDLASVPWFARWAVPVSTGKNRKAAVVHDYLCHPYIQAEYGINQQQADRVFREALDVCAVNPVGAGIMWGFVRSYQAIKGVFK